MKSIKLLNNKDTKYERLSNNYSLKFDMFSKKLRVLESYDSVSNFIYPNMLNSLLYKKRLANDCRPRNVSEEFTNFYQKIINDITSKCIDDSLEEKFKNKEFSDYLINTGNRPIVYISTNLYLGYDEQGNGLNMYGKKLVQFRTMIREKNRKDKADKLEEEMYKSYLAFSCLKNALREGNNLDEFKNLGLDQIIEVYGMQKVLNSGCSKSFFQERVKTDK